MINLTQNQSEATSGLGIRYVKSGPAVLVRVLNQIIQALDSLRLISSEDIEVTRLGTRTQLRLRNRISYNRSVTSATLGPLSLTRTPHYSWTAPVPDTSPPIERFWVTCGTVGGVVVVGDGAGEVGVIDPIELTTAGTVYVYVEADVAPHATSGLPKITAAKVKYGSALPGPPDINATYGFRAKLYYTIARVVVTAVPDTSPVQYEVTVDQLCGANLDISVESAYVSNCTQIQSIVLKKV